MTLYMTLGHRIRKSWIGMHFVIVHGLRLHAEFQNPRSWAVGPSKGQRLACITSVDLIRQGPTRFWWPDLTWPGLENLTGCVKDTREKLPKIWRLYTLPFLGVRGYMWTSSGRGWFPPPLLGTARVKLMSQDFQSPIYDIIRDAIDNLSRFNEYHCMSIDQFVWIWPLAP